VLAVGKPLHPKGELRSPNGRYSTRYHPL